MAKIKALEEQQGRWDKRRDYFVAYTASLMLASNGQIVEPTKILEHQYAPDTTVNFTHDPDIEGAIWEGIKPEPGMFEEEEEEEVDGNPEIY